jgi:hypothetical protein
MLMDFLIQTGTGTYSVSVQYRNSFYFYSPIRSCASALATELK